MNYKLILYYMIFCIFIHILLYRIEFLSNNNWLFFINILILFLMIIQTLFLYKAKIKFLSIPSVFLYFSYIFHLSYQFLIYLDYDFRSMSYAISSNIYGYEVYRKAVSESIKSILYLEYGYFIFIFFGKKIPKKEIKFSFFKNIFQNRKNFKYLINIFFVFSLTADISIIYRRIILMINYGYKEVAIFEANYILIIISHFLLPSLFLIMYFNKKKIIKNYVFLFFFLIYKLIGMFSGLRGYAIVEIIFMGIFFNSYIKKFKKKNIYISLILGYFLLSWLIVIRENRGEGIGINHLKQIFFNKDIILYSMAEFGITINVVCKTIENTTLLLGNMGKQLVISLLSFVPYISRIIPDLFKENIYEKLNLYRMGGSYIADFYYDFGKLNIFLCIIYGILIKNLEENFKTIIQGKEKWKILFLVPFIVEILFTVRSGTFKILRVLVWSYIIVISITSFLYIIIQSSKIIKGEKSGKSKYF